ncbi:hypothetical protein AUJ78_01760 [Candidatus Peregrinibacteria bacterium CG1_02_41_10]|nr:MAG: hypothetical protein AUJ78_01760 [Candidatus Peregrinibacteria bacterium CG1_02_41_10]
MQQQDNLNIYDQIAEEFAVSRRNLKWPEWEYFRPYLGAKSEGQRAKGKEQHFDRVQDMIGILDLGCGSGRLISLVKDYPVEYVGLDVSDKLLIKAKELIASYKLPQYHSIRGKQAISYKLISGGMTDLSFSVDDQFDLVFALASFHHLETDKDRLKCLQEIKRALKPDGHLLMTNWNLWQKRFEKNAVDQNGNLIIPWKNTQSKVLAERVYHRFDLEELEKLFLEAGLVVIKNFKTEFNLVSIVQKVGN